MALVFNTPKTAINTTTRDMQNLSSDCPPCPEVNLTTADVEYTENGEYTVTPEEGYDGLTQVDITVNIPSDVRNQDKLVVPTTSSQTITADSGYSGIGTVSVEAVTSSIDANIAAGNIKKNVSILGVTGTYDPQPTLQAKTATPTTSQQVITPDTGNDGLSQVTISAVTAAIDENIQPENILSGVTILGVEGTDAGYTAGYTEGYDAGQADCPSPAYTSLDETITQSGTYTYDPNDYGGSSYDFFDGATITVTVPSVNNQNKTVAPSINQQSITADSGYSGLGTVTVNAVTNAIDPNIIASNIRDSVSILGVLGTYTGEAVQADPLWIKSLEDGNTIKIEFESDSAIPNPYNIEYSLDGTTWTTAVFERNQPATINLNTDDIVYLRGSNPAIAGGDNVYNAVVFGSSKTVNIGGYLSSVLDSSDYINYRFVRRMPFRRTFYHCKVVNASQLILPKDSVPQCYDQLFTNCTTLEVAPNLPALYVANSAYYRMFYGCTSLRNAPTMTFTMVDTSGCEEMFSGCTSLTTAPIINIYQLTASCFKKMFQNCTGITTIPNGSVYGSTDNYAYGECCNSMFSGCTALETVPQNLLPSYRVEQGGYKYMFDGCTSLLNAPDLPGSVSGLGQGSTECYKSMFSNCTSLTKSPVLGSTTVATRCYENMFSNCTNLTEITCLATSTSYNAMSG